MNFNLIQLVSCKSFMLFCQSIHLVEMPLTAVTVDVLVLGEFEANR